MYHPLTERNGIYTVDLEQFERTIGTETKALLLCSPHNPVGRVWRKRSSEACWVLPRHQVRWCQMKSHHDILMPGHRHCSATRLWQGEENPLPFSPPAKPLIWPV